MAKDGTRQVLATTHNPLVLDGLDLTNPAIRLFAVDRNPQGATQVRRIEVSPELLAEAERGLSLSRLWVIGTPRGRAAAPLMIRVGIVAEGKSDWLALEELMKTVRQDLDFVRLRPDLTLVSHSAHGWKGVRAWCRQEGSRLESLLSGVAGFEIHLLVVHIDCSMAHNVAALHPCPPARDTGLPGLYGSGPFSRRFHRRFGGLAG